MKLCNHVINRFEPSVSIWRVRPQNFHQFQLSSICSSLYYLRIGFRGNHGRVFIPDEIRQPCLWSGSESNLGMWIARIINCIIWKSERDESIISCWVWCQISKEWFNLIICMQSTFAKNMGKYVAFQTFQTFKVIIWSIILQKTSVIILFELPEMKLHKNITI